MENPKNGINFGFCPTCEALPHEPCTERQAPQHIPPWDFRAGRPENWPIVVRFSAHWNRQHIGGPRDPRRSRKR